MQVVSSTTRSFLGTNCSLGFSKRPCDNSQCPRFDSLLWRVPLAAYLAAPDLCVNFTAFLNKPLFFRAPQIILCNKSRTASPKQWPVSQINNISHVTVSLPKPPALWLSLGPVPGVKVCWSHGSFLMPWTSVSIQSSRNPIPEKLKRSLSPGMTSQWLT